MPCGVCMPRGWWGAVPRGGWPATIVRGVWCQALILPWPPVLWGGQPGFRDPCVPGAVGAGVGPSTGLTACALAGRRPSLWGWRKGVPGGGAFHRCDGRLWSGAPPPRTARPLGGLFFALNGAFCGRPGRLLGGLLGSATHMLWARACWCGGPTLSPWPACPVGAACPGGGGGPSPGGVACHCCEGRLVSGAVPPQSRPSSGAGSQGSATRVPRLRSVRAWEPSTGPTACALAGRHCSLWGWRKGVPGGAALHHCEGRLRPGAVPPPTARPLGGLSGPATPVLWARVCGCGGPILVPLACMPCGGCVPRG